MQYTVYDPECLIRPRVTQKNRVCACHIRNLGAAFGIAISLAQSFEDVQIDAST